MADNISFDFTEFDTGLSKLESAVNNRVKSAVHDIATEIMRLSQIEVPHDTGNLQNSGQVDPGEDDLEWVVGYNTTYAAKLHEHPEYHFQAGRKGKYLEDPIKMNLGTFQKYFEGILSQ